MQVNLFANDRIMNSYSRDLHHLSTKPVDIGVVFGQNVDRYKVANPEDSSDVLFHKAHALGYFDVRKKTYENCFGALYDRHHELAKLNILLGYGPYVTIISLEDSLDYVLHSLCGCNIQKVREIPKYQELSRALLKLNFGENLYNFAISDFVGIDPKLNHFIKQLELDAKASMLEGEDAVDEEEDSEEFNEILDVRFLTAFITKIITKVDDINKYLGYNYKLERGEAVTVKSKSACSFVLAAKERFEHNMTIKAPGCDDYTLYVRSFERGEYETKIDLPYVAQEVYR